MPEQEEESGGGGAGFGSGGGNSSEVFDSFGSGSAWEDDSDEVTGMRLGNGDDLDGDLIILGAANREEEDNQKTNT